MIFHDHFDADLQVERSLATSGSLSSLSFQDLKTDLSQILPWNWPNNFDRRRPLLGASIRYGFAAHDWNSIHEIIC